MNLRLAVRKGVAMALRYIMDTTLEYEVYRNLC